LRTELSYSYNKNRDEKVRPLGIDTRPITNDIMAIRCVKGTQSDQQLDFQTFEMSCFKDNII